MQPLLNKSSTVLAFVCLGLLASCTTQDSTGNPQLKPEVKPASSPAEQAATTTQTPPVKAGKVSANAKIYFESDYARDTEFSVNDKNVVGNACSDFADVKYADKLAKGKSGKSARVGIVGASSMPVAVTARHHVEAKGLYSSCGPLTRVFVPEANAAYVAKLVREKTGKGDETGLCVLDIKKIDAVSGKGTPVKTMAFSQCTQ